MKWLVRGLALLGAAVVAWLGITWVTAEAKRYDQYQDRN